jgi:hypothetical protein
MTDKDKTNATKKQLDIQSVVVVKKDNGDGQGFALSTAYGETIAFAKKGIVVTDKSGKVVMTPSDDVCGAYVKSEPFDDLKLFDKEYVKLGTKYNTMMDSYVKRYGNKKARKDPKVSAALVNGIKTKHEVLKGSIRDDMRAKLSGKSINQVVDNLVDFATDFLYNYVELKRRLNIKKRKVKDSLKKVASGKGAKEDYEYLASHTQLIGRDGKLVKAIEEIDSDEDEDDEDDIIDEVEKDFENAENEDLSSKKADEEEKEAEEDKKNTKKKAKKE